MRTIEHWINGQTTTGHASRTAPVWDPAAGTQQAQVMLAGPDDVDAAVRAAAKAFSGWSRTSLSARTKVLFRFRELFKEHVDELAKIVCSEHGKVFDDARGEVERGLDVVDFACGIPQLLKGDYSGEISTGVDAFSYREPLGVVVGITPFNFPVMVPMWLQPIAIATGNAFILKPSERDPSASMLVAELWRQAGLPDGVFNVVHGDKIAVDALLDHSDVAAVSFVGSTPIARYVHRQATAAGKRVQALGGAKNHAIVLPDADVDDAAAHLTSAGFGSAGQRCMAISAVVAVGGAGDPLVEALHDRTRAIRVGPGNDEASEMGPVVTREAQHRISGAIERAVEQRATLVVDGRSVTVPGLENGFFVGPSLLDNVDPQMDVYRDEIFGPVLVVVRAESLDDAIDVVNANPYGNGAAIFTSSGAAARRFQQSVRVGMVGVNVPIPVPMAYYSFGGWKDSLFGDRNVHGTEGVAFYTRAKTVTARWPQIALPTAPTYQFPTAE